MGETKDKKEKISEVPEAVRKPWKKGSMVEMICGKDRFYDRSERESELSVINTQMLCI